MPSPRTVLTALLAAAALGAATLPATASAASSSSARVSETPVAFTVQNVNQTQMPCATDGATYTIRGHLNATAAERRSGKVTLLLHGLGLGEFFWRAQNLPGYDFARNLARAGHATVTIDRLGYGASDKPAGTGSCIGGQADIAHQIIGDLKTGGFQGGGGARFDRVGLAGHSAGGLIAEVESYSFHDARAIGVLAYADQGLSQFQLSLGAAAAKTCAAGGMQQSITSGPGGYASLASNLDQGYDAFFNSAATWATAAALPQLSLDPCGDLASYAKAQPVDLQHIGSITQPVLAVQGGRDTLFPPPSVEQQAKLFTGSKKVTYADLPRAAHALTYEQGHVQLATIMAKFLSANGL